MGRRRPDRHYYGPRGEYRGHSSNDSPLTKLVHTVIGAVVLAAVALGVLRGCQ